MPILGGKNVSVFSSATAPSNPYAGQVWYDTSNNNTWIYDGTTWNTWITGGNLGSIGNPITSASLGSFGGNAGEYYYIQTPNGSIGSAIYSGANYKGTGKKYFKMWQADQNSAPSENLIAEGHFFNEILIENSGGTWHNAIFASHRPYATTSDTTTSTGGSRTGYRVYLGYAGGHGIYNTSQNPCSWGNSAGAWGAGYINSTCGSWPNGLLMGSGISGSPAYTAVGGTWQFWITF